MGFTSSSTGDGFTSLSTGNVFTSLSTGNVFYQPLVLGMHGFNQSEYWGWVLPV